MDKVLKIFKLSNLPFYLVNGDDDIMYYYSMSMNILWLISI